MRRILVLANAGILIAVVVATVLMIRDAGHESVASGAVPAAKVDRFDGARAWSWVKRQIAYGQRPAGSPQLRRLARVLRAQVPHGHLHAPRRPGGPDRGRR